MKKILYIFVFLTVTTNINFAKAAIVFSYTLCPKGTYLDSCTKTNSEGNETVYKFNSSKDCSNLSSYCINMNKSSDGTPSQPSLATINCAKCPGTGSVTLKTGDITGHEGETYIQINLSNLSKPASCQMYTIYDCSLSNERTDKTGTYKYQGGGNTTCKIPQTSSN